MVGAIVSAYVGSLLGPTGISVGDTEEPDGAMVGGADGVSVGMTVGLILVILNTFPAVLSTYAMTPLSSTATPYSSPSDDMAGLPVMLPVVDVCPVPANTDSIALVEESVKRHTNEEREVEVEEVVR